MVASKGGWAQHPLWYLNLQANPNVTIEDRRDKLPMRARTANAEERARLWPRLVAVYGDYANYQSWTDREIPVVILSPRQYQFFCSDFQLLQKDRATASIGPPVDRRVREGGGSCRSSSHPHRQESTMRFMMMHKNDPNTEAGQPAPDGARPQDGRVHRRARRRRAGSSTAPASARARRERAWSSATGNARRSAAPIAASTSCRRRRCCSRSARARRPSAGRSATARSSATASSSSARSTNRGTSA